MWPRGEDPDVMLRRRLGAALLHWWEPRPELVGEDGFVDSITALAGDADFANGTSGVTWISSGGPVGRPYIELSSATACIEALPTWPTSRVALYVVQKFSSAAVDQTAFITRASTGSGPTRHVVMRPAAGQYYGAMRFSTGVVGVTSGTADANWHAWSLRPLATGASWRKDGVEMNPTFAQSDTMQGGGCAQIGAFGAGSGGSWACSMLVDLATDPSARNQAVADYIFQRFGLRA
jgi:hypothetical protein